MTQPAALRNINIQPLDQSHSAASIGTGQGNTSLSVEQQTAGLVAQFAILQAHFADNATALANRRRQLRQSDTSLRIISDVGLEDLTSLGHTFRGRGAPFFQYFPPKTNDSLRPFRAQGLIWVVFHSFGGGFDQQVFQNNTLTVPIDPVTGFNPRRFINGLNTLLNPSARSHDGGLAGAAIHHAISLRGDLVNSVSWDDRCQHGGNNGGAPSLAGLNINDQSIGIEHEEWYVRRQGLHAFDDVVDKGPFSEEQYAIDAFILKKLEAYTGKSFTNYLGFGTDCLQRLRNNEVGCFNHAVTFPEHNDPGAEFILPPDFELGVSDLRTVPETSARFREWRTRLARWYPDTAPGTRISAYARIFDKVARLRSFNLQTEVFDPALSGNIVQVTPPEVLGNHVIGVAQAAGRDRISGYQRTQEMQAASRVSLYSAAQDTNSAVITATARASSRLGQIINTALLLPIIVDAVGFNFATGLWENRTTVNNLTASNDPLLQANANPTPTTTNNPPGR